MTILSFILGLALGLLIYTWYKIKVEQQLQQLKDYLQVETNTKSLSLITHIRKAIQQEKSNTQDLKGILHHWEKNLAIAPIGYLIVDPDNQLIWCNRAAQKLLQIDQIELGRLLLELVRSYELDQIIQETRQQNQITHQEWDFHPTSLDAAEVGKIKSITIKATSIPLSNGEIGVFLENRQEITNLLKFREQWISDLAHQLRTPLTSISLVVQNLEQAELTLPYSDWIIGLERETNRLIHLVNNWLELSAKVKKPEDYLTKQPIELWTLLFSVWNTLEPLADKKELKLSYDRSPAIWIEADESKLTQVFLNIIENSIKYSYPKGIIRIEIKQHYQNNIPHQIEISIIDSGIGFEEQDLPHIFERFYRGEVKRTSISSKFDQSWELEFSSSGTGLGLAIAQQIIQAHNGTIEATNHPVTGGATLKITLPLE